MQEDKEIILQTWKNAPVCNRYNPNTMRDPSLLEGKTWFDNLTRIRKHLYGDIFLLESHCEGCPGRRKQQGDEKCRASCATGYIMTDMCPDIWYDMPCYNGEFGPRYMYTVTVKCEDNKKYLAKSFDQLQSFIASYIFNWKGPLTDSMSGYIPSISELNRNKTVENQYYKVETIDIRIHVGIDKLDKDARKALEGAVKQWEDILAGLSDYSEIKGLKRHCAAPPRIEGIRLAVPFGRQCKEKDCTVGCEDCMMCEWNADRIHQEEIDHFMETQRYLGNGQEALQRHMKRRFLTDRKYYIDCLKEAGNPKNSKEK